MLFRSGLPDSHKNIAVFENGRRVEYFVNFNRMPIRTREYDADMRLISSSDVAFTTGSLPDPTYGGLRPSMEPATVASDSGVTTTYEYLNAGDPAAHPWDRLFVSRQSDAAGGFVEYSYDDNYRVTQIRRPLNRNTSMTYDAEGNVTSVTDAEGNTSFMEYDAWGRLVRTEDPTSGVVR